MLGNLYYYGRYGCAEKINAAKPVMMPWESFDEVSQKMPDYQQAFKWYEKSAEAGYVYAMNNLGIMYHFGQGIAQNDEKAKEYLLLCAQAGFEQSIGALQDFYGIEV
ncbi:MAG: sel1 repeat family protein [Clostridia bacterium]|nr:sel1 repeat family protein [Clostridia bacterium]